MYLLLVGYLFLVLLFREIVRRTRKASAGMRKKNEKKLTTWRTNIITAKDNRSNNRNEEKRY